MSKPKKGDGKRGDIATSTAVYLIDLAAQERLSTDDQAVILDRLSTIFADKTRAGKNGSKGFYGNIRKDEAEKLCDAAKVFLAAHQANDELNEMLEKIVASCSETIRIRCLQSPVYRAEHGIKNRPKRQQRRDTGEPKSSDVERVHKVPCNA